MTYRGLGFDPTSGSVDAVSAVVAQLHAAADALSAAESGLRAAAEHAATWQGPAAEAFRAHAVPPADPTRLRAAVPVLERWAETLAANKRRTEELDARALRLRGALDDARDDLQDKQNERDLAATPVAAATANAAVTAATERVAAAEDALATVLAEARALAAEHLRAADEAAAALGAAPVQNQPSEVETLTNALRRSSRTAAALGALVARDEGRLPHAGGDEGRLHRMPTGAVAEALVQRSPGTGEMIELSETRR